MATSSVSISNTPQANGDSYAYTEDELLANSNIYRYDGTYNYLVLDVMANDLGGNAKKLYSIDDGDGALSELLASNVTTGWESTAQGNQIRINAGKIEFRILQDQNGNDLSATGANGLGAGQHLTDSFVYTIRLGNGTLSYATVAVDITGTNDALALVSADDAGSVMEKAEPNEGGTLSDSGNIVFADVDVTDVHTAMATAVGVGYLGTFTPALNQATKTVTWMFSVADSAVDYLAAGQQLTQSYTVSISDGTASVDQTVTITITGTNDGPVVAAADVTGAVTELVTPMGNLSDSGTISFSDVDLTDVHSVGGVTASAGALGSLTASVTTDTTGSGTGGVISWNYTVAASAVEYLAQGQTKVETFSFTLSDGNGGTVERTVSVTLTGTNDAPNIAVQAADSAGASLTETNAGLLASGTLTVTDVDFDDTVTTSVTSVALSGTSGGLTATDVLSYLSVSPAGALAANPGTTNNLGWAFNSDTQAFDFLNLGQSLTLTYTLTSSDNSGAANNSDTQTVTITINGTADGPAPAPAVVGAADANDKNFGEPGAVQSAQIAVTRISIGSGSEKILGTVNNDTIAGNNGNDTIYGFDGDDVLGGDNQNDVIYGGTGNDTITGGQDTDVIYGGSGNDSIQGGQGVDSLYGGQGDDTILGDGQNDFIYGGHGADSLTGHGGDDSFIFLSTADTGDTVTDFDTAGNDKLDFSAIDANVSGTGDQAFVSVSNTETLVANGVIWFQTGGNTVVQVDTDGNTATAEMQIQLTGLKTLTAADFVL